jgi:hypothetical protein
MVETASTQSEIPEAAFYVTAIDSFMSGWGGAQGKSNVICLPCVDESQAKKAMAYMLSRPEIEKIKVSRQKPLVDVEATVSVFNPQDQPVWYGLVRREVELDSNSDLTV